MKKYTSIIILLFAILLTSCSGDDVATGTATPVAGDSVVIAFESYIGRPATRGSVETSTTLQYNGVAVYACYTKGGTYSSGSYTTPSSVGFTPNEMNGTKVMNSSWTYRTIHFWPQGSDEYLSFLAFGPYSSKTLMNSNELYSGDRTYIKHTVDNTPANQTDLVYASALDKYYRVKYTESGSRVNRSTSYSSGVSSSGTVTLSFSHATSRIGFSITSTALADPSNFTESPTVDNTQITSNATITINKIVLLGDNSSATKTTPTGAFYMTGLLNLKDGSWTETSTDKQEFSFYASSDTKPMLKGTASYGGGTVIYYNSITINNSDYLFIIPQDFTTDDLYLYIDYTVNYSSGVSGDVSKGINYTRYIKVPKNFEEGKAYLLKLDIGDSNSFRPISLNVETVEGWGDEETVTPT